ncbi:hypothetical protein [Anaerobium acetethylicum]|uniref:Uncharacterized protein n=1 Tax=Anaerobium acetethylicum TaxID=1619234 RepID=A0A1D3TW63_9FIRM|nr:hypothetical protein [Anaerobium acetethylicum]SCP98429.1 hypothetical protein SAMN05421730_102040 [Anaerobium acetethylicum]
MKVNVAKKSKKKELIKRVYFKGKEDFGIVCGDMCLLEWVGNSGFEKLQVLFADKKLCLKGPGFEAMIVFHEQANLEKMSQCKMKDVITKVIFEKS